MYTQTKYPGLIIDINTKLLKDKRLRVIGRGINPEAEAGRRFSRFIPRAQSISIRRLQSTVGSGRNTHGGILCTIKVNTPI